MKRIFDIPFGCIVVAIVVKAKKIFFCCNNIDHGATFENVQAMPLITCIAQKKY
jgi:hypothetical protein